MDKMKSLLLQALLLAFLLFLAGCGGFARPTATPLPLTSASISEPEAPSVPPPRIPHDLEGRENCLMCHEAGAVGAPTSPADHAGWTNEACQRCHTASSQRIATSVVAPPPQVPHDLKGRDDCLMCHKLGIGQAPRYPDDHAGRTNDVCKVCHTAPVASQLGGQEIFASVCARCHADSGEGRLGPTLNSEEFLTSHDEAAIRQAIVKGVDGTEMLAWGDLGLLTEGQIDELVTFITSWKGALSTASAEGGLKTGVGEDVREPQTSASSVEPSNEVSGQLPSFTEDILPLLQSKCSACHGNLGGWSAASYDEVINSGDSGPAVVPGDAEGSLLLQKLKDTQTIGGPMPPSQLLSDEEIALVEEWIAAGAPDN